MIRLKFQSHVRNEELWYNNWPKADKANFEQLSDMTIHLLYSFLIFFLGQFHSSHIFIFFKIKVFSFLSLVKFSFSSYQAFKFYLANSYGKKYFNTKYTYYFYYFIILLMYFRLIKKLTHTLCRKLYVKISLAVIVHRTFLLLAGIV